MLTSVRNIALIVSLSAISAVATAQSNPTTERDDCISSLRGLAEMNAKLADYAIVRQVDGNYTDTSTSTKCTARFEATKDGKMFLTEYYTGETAKR